MLLVTHEMGFASSSYKVVVMDEGKIIEVGPPS